MVRVRVACSHRLLVLRERQSYYLEMSPFIPQTFFIITNPFFALFYCLPSFTSLMISRMISAASGRLFKLSSVSS